MSTDPPTIVAYISQNWIDGEPETLENMPLGTHKRFEHAIEVNRKRDYRLDSWQLTTCAYTAEDGTPGINDTIVAVFVRAAK